MLEVRSARILMSVCLGKHRHRGRSPARVHGGSAGTLMKALAALWKGIGNRKYTLTQVAYSIVM